ncbi:hypothetical protein ACTXT7_016391 [Hymenolepis weldensis]
MNNPSQSPVDDANLQDNINTLARVNTTVAISLLIITMRNFYAPEFMCRMVKYMQGTSIYASSFALILLSFDRAEVVINPMRSTTKVCFGGLNDDQSH